MPAPAIDIRRLHKVFRLSPGLRARFARRSALRSVTALDNVDLEIRHGEIFGLVGRNGMGKTTLVKSIAGLIEPTRGTVAVDGLDAARNLLAVKRRVGLVTSEDRSFYWRLSGWQNLLFFARLHGLTAAQARERMQRWSELFEFDQVIDRPVHQYSLGNRQRLAILRALLVDPPILLLDEPTRSLDPIVARDFRQLIRERVHADGHRTVLITSNNLDDIEDLCQRIAIINRGRIAACDTLEALLQNHAGEETVTLLLRAPHPGASPDTLDLDATDLATRPAADGLLELSFTRAPRDAALNTVLRALVRADYEIVDCAIRRQDLRDIMQAVDAGEPTP